MPLIGVPPPHLSLVVPRRVLTISTPWPLVQLVGFSTVFFDFPPVRYFQSTPGGGFAFVSLFSLFLYAFSVVMTPLLRGASTT